ncbi:translation initiation factor IF-2 [Perognathus longimembris pacificus]|uniref:translation initiation factor IF-2 n=1 Tax=Perognathus longimembris pacificus TaxID=214514 RepID=UPI002019CAC4|nr:translation initiation factor IF-2 [Perognathus longimembris pacificus]
MPQGVGSLAARGGALGLGAGREAEADPTSEREPVEGGARRPGAGPGRPGGGAWSVEAGLAPERGGASGLEKEGAGAQAPGAGLHPGSGVAPAPEKECSSAGGGASGPGAELRPLEGGAKDPEGGAKDPGAGLSQSNGQGRPRGGGLRGGGAWGRGRPRTPPGEVVWVERARRPADSGPIWVPRRPPRAQSWGGAPGGGTGPGWGVPPGDRGSPEPSSGDVWVPRGRPPAAATEVWVCWAGGTWVWREWGRSVGATPVQSDRVWTLRKGTGGN